MATSVNLITPKENRTISVLKKTASVVLQDSPLIIPPSPLMKRLGCGTYVTIYRYKRVKPSGIVGSPWAIKKAKKGHARKSILDRLASEATILRNLRHPNIVLFKKFNETTNGDVCLSMEAFGKGLDDIIFRHQEDEEIFTAKQTTQVAYSIACALDYLHGEKNLLHGDMKSGNILVKGDFELVKLCDFGVSIFLKNDLSGPKNPADSYVGSEPWYSKEVLNGGPVTDKADIFAYGLVLWEMLALDVPHIRHMHGDTSDLDGSFLSTANDTLSIPDAYYEALGTRPPMPDFDYSPEYDPTIGTFICCTIEDYKKRPSARQILSSLGEIIQHFGITPLSSIEKSDKLTSKNKMPEKLLTTNMTLNKTALQNSTSKTEIGASKDKTDNGKADNNPSVDIDGKENEKINGNYLKLNKGQCTSSGQKDEKQTELIDVVKKVTVTSKRKNNEKSVEPRRSKRLKAKK